MSLFSMHLVNSIKNGDARVFEQVFLDWQPKVYTYYTRRTKDPVFSEELTQRCFIRLWDFRHTLSEDLDLDTQLFRIARTTMVDSIREKERLKKLYEGYSSLNNLQDSACEIPVIESLEMAGALNRLPPVRKKVFLLSRLHGYSYQEIANKLSLSDRTVEKHISLALKQLKKISYFLSVLLFLRS